MDAFSSAEVQKFLNLLKGTNGKKLFMIIRYFFLQIKYGKVCLGRPSTFVTVHVLSFHVGFPFWEQQSTEYKFVCQVTFCIRNNNFDSIINKKQDDLRS